MQTLSWHNIYKSKYSNKDRINRIFQDKQDVPGWTLKDKELTQKIIGYAFKVYSTLGKEFLKKERMNMNVIFRFILFILKYHVNPVRVFLRKSDSQLLHPLILLKTRNYNHPW